MGYGLFSRDEDLVSRIETHTMQESLITRLKDAWAAENFKERLEKERAQGANYLAALPLAAYHAYIQPTKRVISDWWSYNTGL